MVTTFRRGEIGFHRLSSPPLKHEESVYIPVADSGTGATVFSSPHVAHNEEDGTFALAWDQPFSGGSDVRLRIVSDRDLTDVVTDVSLHRGQSVFQVDAVATPSRGGYMVVWDDTSFDGGAQLTATHVESDGTIPVPGGTAIAQASEGLFGFASLARRSDHEFFVLFASLPRSGAGIRMRRVVVSDTLDVLHSSRIITNETSWSAVYQPHAVAQPNGSVLCVFTYQRADDVLRIESMTFTAFGTIDLPERYLLAGTSVDPQAIGGRPAWHAGREEFVVPVTRPDAHSRFRRITPDGLERAPVASPLFEGVAGVAWCGTEPLSFGVALTTDGTFDGQSQFFPVEAVVYAYPFW